MADLQSDQARVPDIELSHPVHTGPCMCHACGGVQLPAASMVAACCPTHLLLSSQGAHTAGTPTLSQGDTQPDDGTTTLAQRQVSGSAEQQMPNEVELVAAAGAAPAMAAPAARTDGAGELGVHDEAAQQAPAAQADSVTAGAAALSGDCAEGGARLSAAPDGDAMGQQAARGLKRPAPDQDAADRAAAEATPRPRKHRRGPGHRLFRTLRGVGRLLFSALAPTFAAPAAAVAAPALASVVQVQLPPAAAPAAPQVPTAQHQPAQHAGEDEAEAMQPVDDADSMQPDIGSINHTAESAHGAQAGPGPAHPVSSDRYQPALCGGLAGALRHVGKVSWLDDYEEDSDIKWDHLEYLRDVANAEAASSYQTESGTAVEAAELGQDAAAPGAAEVEAAAHDAAPSTSGASICELKGFLPTLHYRFSSQNHLTLPSLIGGLWVGRGAGRRSPGGRW